MSNPCQPLNPPDTKLRMMEIWRRNRPQVLERLDLLDRIAQTDPLPDSLRQEGTSVAHKLAGSLGMFGFAEGTRIARLLEEHLEDSELNRELLAALSNQLRETLFPAIA